MSDKKITIDDLVDVFSNSFPEDKDPKMYRYAIYARKSTEDAEKQVQSLENQIEICLGFAQKNNFYIQDPKKDVYQESQSAKTSGTRAVFKHLLQEVYDGKYDGIIAWHPDRLARNMMDAGEIIDMLDRKIILDLKFPSFTFNNTDSDKMLLGITFVMSKQYSDSLSKNVLRGNTHKLNTGALVGRTKIGYIKDKNDRLQLDKKNFPLVQKAFEMKLEGKTYEMIGKYLKDNNLSIYVRKTDSYRKVTMDKRRAHELLKNPVYAGVLMHGEHVANLNDYYEFDNAVDPHDFATINRIDGSDVESWKKLWRQYSKGDAVKANLMRGMVICSECGDTMTTTMPRGSKGQIYYYFRCENKDTCKRKKKNVRAKVVMEYIIDYLNKKPFSHPKAYNHYKKEIEHLSKHKVQELESGLKGLNTRAGNIESSIDELKAYLPKEDDIKLRKEFKEDLKKKERSLIEIQQEQVRLKAKITRQKDKPLELEEFLELFDNLATAIAEEPSMEKKDKLIKKVFLNFYLKEKSVDSSTLSSPFDSLETNKVLLGGR